MPPWYEPKGLEHSDAYLLFSLGEFDFLEVGPHRFEVLLDDAIARTVTLEVRAPGVTH